MFRAIISLALCADALSFAPASRVRSTSAIKMALFDGAVGLVGSDIEYPGALIKAANYSALTMPRRARIDRARRG